MDRIPEQWRRYFAETVVGTHEGGYVNTQFGGTLFGMMANYFPVYLKDTPREEINALPPDIRGRLHNPPELFQYIGRMLKPMGGGHQPASGVPRPSLAEVANPRHGETVDAAKDLIYGMYYRHYVVEPGFDKIPEPIREQVVDLAIHGGNARAYAILVKAMAEADIITQQRYASYPAMTSTDLHDNASFARSRNGGDYQLSSTKNKIIDDLRDATPEQLQLMAAWVVPWRKMSKDCTTGEEHRRCVGENRRADSYLPEGVDKLAEPLRVARMQVARDGWTGPYRIALEAEGGSVEYTLEAREGGYAVKDITGNHGLTSLFPGQKLEYRAPHSMARETYINPYLDTVVFAAVDTQFLGNSRTPQVFYASPQVNEAALEYNRNTNWGFTRHQITRDSDGRLSPDHSFYIVYGGPKTVMQIVDAASPEEAIRGYDPTLKSNVQLAQPSHVPGIERVRPATAEELLQASQMPSVPANVRVVGDAVRSEGMDLSWLNPMNWIGDARAEAAPAAPARKAAVRE